MIDIDELRYDLGQLKFNEEFVRNEHRKNEVIPVLTDAGVSEFLTKIYDANNCDLVVAIESYFDEGIGCSDDDMLEVQVSEEWARMFKFESALGFVEDWYYENMDSTY